MTSFAIDELKKCHTEVADIYKIFIALYHQQYDTKPIENFEYLRMGRFGEFGIDTNYRHWAHTVSVMTLGNKINSMLKKALIGRLLNVFARIGQLSIFTQYFENNRNLSDDIIPLLISQCNKFGWLPFSEILCNMFKEVKKFSIARQYFQRFIEIDGSIDPNKQAVLQSVLNAILDNESKRHRCDKKKFFDAVWSMGKESGLDVREFYKSQRILDIVPFAIQQAERDGEIKSDHIWREIVDHFLLRMKRFLATKPATNWRQANVEIPGQCDCLENLKIFLADNVESITLNLHEVHRNHIRKALDHINHIACRTSQVPGKADIVVKKTRQADQDKVYTYERIHRLNNQLHSMLPRNTFLKTCT